jgi:hypothetical protein
MALSSPGVEVKVIDESFYTPAEPGTVPMIFVASAQDKTNGAGTGTAPGTLLANAGKPYLITSQRDLVETFGEPSFKTDTNNNPIHAGELNEYGLQAAYSLLGVSNRAYVTRAAIDLDALTATATAPTANPAAGTYWFDTATSIFGIFAWNSASADKTGGQSFTNKVPTVITDATKVTGGAPKGSVGAIGDYAIVATTTLNKLYYKNYLGTWVQAGTTAWKASHGTVAGSSNPTITQSNTLVINSTTVTSSSTTSASLVGDINTAAISGITAAAIDGVVTIFSTGANVVLAEGTGALAEAGLTAGTYYAPVLTTAPHTSVPEYKSGDTNPRPSGSLWIKTTQPNKGANWKVKVWNDATKLWDTSAAPIYNTPQEALYNLDKTLGGSGLAMSQLYIKANDGEATVTAGDFKIYKRAATGATTITSGIITTGMASESYVIKISESIVGNAAMSAQVSCSGTTTGAATDAEVVANSINAAGLTNVSATVDAQNRVVISHSKGGDFRIEDATGTAFAGMGFSAYVNANSGTTNLYTAPAGDTTNDFVASNWKVLTYTASTTAPTALAADNTLWYNSITDECDIMVHNGTTWVGYLDSTSPYYSASATAQTSPAGPIVSATAPLAATGQSDGTALVNGDIWVSTASLDDYPTIYKWSSALVKWVLVDSSDQTTEDGILYADARWGLAGATSDVAGTIIELLTNNYLDPDAPDPALYPKGMMLFNLRRSGFNVKKFVRNYIDTNAVNKRFNSDEAMTSYYTHRWVTESANQADGKGSFGQGAQRKVVIQSLQAMLNSNDAIRDDESRIFNVIATPGYPELIGEMVTLNTDRGLTAFVLGDSPPKLTPDATSLNEWGTNVNLAVEDNANGLVTSDEYLGVYYPWGFSSDNAGNNVVIPPSHMMLRTIALSDQVSYPWFAPAGTRRGGITNATATGYIDNEGEFNSIALNEGQRDTLQGIKVNPITFMTGAGLVAFGQKTRAKNASSLDRINVARLVVYMRSQLNKLAKPYIFEPNDKITRDEIKQAAESLCLELVGSRALYDYLVVCDESNNTPSRIDKNELYLDIAIEPVKAVEFIYIPLRLKNTGEIAGL